MNSNENCYINLLSKDEQNQLSSSSAYESSTNKSDGISSELRMRGNQKFNAKNWDAATELYNQSLRYATDGSENISLAYANRSACFLEMKKYDQCLADIELAKRAKYPNRLMHKLKEREEKCVKSMCDQPEQSNEKGIKPVLSFDAHEKYPFLSNALEIRSNSKLGNHIVAKHDIDVGKMVVVEDMMVTNIHSTDKTFCKTCLKTAKNFIPCRSCSEVMFCDDHCMASDTIHAMSCHTLRNQIFAVIRAVESILLAVTAFPDSRTFMEFVEQALATRDLDTPECVSDTQTKYSLFLKLGISTDGIMERIKRVVFGSYRSLLGIPEIQRRFQSKQERRFLMHLILQHDLNLTRNCAVFRNDYLIAKIPEVSGIGLFQSLINHSCVQNVSVKRHENQICIYTLRPVKMGEQLLNCNAIAKEDYQCKCSKCVPKWKQRDENRLRSEPEYKYVMQRSGSTDDDPEKHLVLKTKLINLMQKYGRLPWSPEIENVSLLFDGCMEKEICD